MRVTVNVKTPTIVDAVVQVTAIEDWCVAWDDVVVRVKMDSIGFWSTYVGIYVWVKAVTIWQGLTFAQVNILVQVPSSIWDWLAFAKIGIWDQIAAMR